MTTSLNKVDETSSGVCQYLLSVFLQLIDYKSDLSLDEYFQTCDELVLLNANGSHHMGHSRSLDGVLNEILHSYFRESQNRELGQPCKDLWNDNKKLVKANSVVKKKREKVVEIWLKQFSYLKRHQISPNRLFPTAKITF